jgi:hypothetical protein
MVTDRLREEYPWRYLSNPKVPDEPDDSVIEARGNGKHYPHCDKE